MKKYFLIFVLILAVAFTSFAGVGKLTGVASAKTCGEPLCGLVVSATGTAKVQPDYASISFSVETKNAVIEDAQRENAEKVQTLKESLAGQNINESDIKTAGFNVYPEYDYNNGFAFVGYKVTNQINVRVKDIDNVGKVIDAATNSGANVVSGVQFLVEDSTAGYNAALENAIELAKQKAAVFSRTANIDEIKIVSIREISNGTFGGYGKICCAKLFDSAMLTSTQIMQGDVEFSATVEMVYEIV